MGGQDHTFPSYSQDASELSSLNFLFSSMLNYLNGSQHTPCYFILLSLCLCCPSNIHFFWKSFFSSRKTLPWTLPTRCSLSLSWHFAWGTSSKSLLCLSSSWVYKEPGPGIPSEESLLSWCLTQKKHSKNIGLKNYTLGKAYTVSVLFLTTTCEFTMN